MVTTTPTARPAVNALASGRLPRRAPLLLLAACLLVMAGVFTIVWMGGGDGAEFNIVGTIFFGVVLYAIVIYVAARLVEGARRAADRLVTTLVTLAFVVALLPSSRCSSRWSCVARRDFDVEFLLLLDAQRRRRRRGRTPRDRGHGAHHPRGVDHLHPVGLLASIYLVEYGRGVLARAITFFVDVMTGIPSIVAGLFAYALFAILLGPGVKLGIAAPSRSRCS